MTEQWEALLRAVSDLRAEIRADMASLRTEMAEARRATVDRGEHTAQLAALDQRITVLESYRESRRTGLVYPAIIMVLSVALGVLITMLIGGGR